MKVVGEDIRRALHRAAGLLESRWREWSICAANTDESTAEMGCSAVSDMKARASGDGEPVPA